MKETEATKNSVKELKALLEQKNRELEIEAALERVRARTMAMQNSEELAEVSYLLNKQVVKLGIPTRGCAFNIYNENDATEWFSNIEGTIPAYKTPRENIFLKYYEAGQRGETLWIEEFSKERIKEHYRYLATLNVVEKKEDTIKESVQIIPKYQIDHVAYFKYGYLLFITLVPAPQAHGVFKRFAKEFEQTYTRFLDLQKAEAQAKEAQIEAALERIRSRTMAMQNSSELAETSIEMFKQMQALGMRPWACGFNIFEKDEKAVTQWMSAVDGSLLTPFTTPLTEDPFFIKIYEARQRGEELFVMESGGHELEETYKYMFSLPAAKLALGDILAAGFDMPKFQISHCAFFSQGYLMFITYEPYSEAHDIFKRFAKVFEQTYTRFLDLQKAEAQVREAQIEAALERVRARSIGMHKSEELVEVVRILDKEINGLGVEVNGTQIATDFANPEDGLNVWYARDGQDYLEKFHIPYLEHPLTKRPYNALHKGVDFYTENYSKGEKNKYFRLLFKYSDFRKTTKERQEFIYNSPTWIRAVAVFKNSFLVFQRFDLKEFTKKEEGIFKRFGKVFEQAYTRFLDLQKAEAQTREAQIEAALERVRSRTMGMQRSDELLDAALLLFQQIQGLGVPPFACGFNIWDDDRKAATAWMGSVGGLGVPFKTDSSKDVYLPIYETAQRGESLFVVEQAGKELEDHYAYLATIPIFRDIVMEEWKQKGVSIPTFQIIHCAYFSQGYLMFITYEPAESAYDIFKRFAKVFEQTYTRFLDLQKAEAQAREARIEAALERVRSRTMGMQKSTELAQTANLMFEQIQTFGVDIWSCGFNIWKKEERIFTSWMSSKGILLPPMQIPLTENIAFIHFDESRRRGDSLFVDKMSGEILEEHYRYMTTIPGIKEAFDVIADEGLTLPSYQINHLANFSHGNLMFITYEPCPQLHDIFKRFAKVFEQTYTRFLDLQKVEAQTREAQIEAALERVRARSMAMYDSAEMLEVADVLFQQIRSLGGEMWGCGVVICQQGTDDDEVWFANEKGVLPPIAVPHNEDSTHKKMYEGWIKKLELFTESKEGIELKEHYNYMLSVPTVKPLFEDILESGLTFPDWQKWHAAYFSCGYLLFITLQEYDDERIFVRFAKVFEQAYTRFLDLQKAEAQAREAQIEAALERVRSRTIGMQRSDELQDAALLLFQQIQGLGVPPFGCGFNIWDDDRKAATAWMGGVAGLQVPFKTDSSKDVYLPIYKAAQRGESLFVLEQSGKELEVHYAYLASIPIFRENIMETWKRDGISAPTFQIIHCAYFSHGYLMFITFEPASFAYDIFKRFAKVFEQTYTRFLDLQKAEKQAREAVKQASLDRVRGEIASMRTKDDLNRITPLIWKELTALGVPFIRCGVFILDDENQNINSYLSTPSGESIAAFRLPYDTPGNFAEIVSHWRLKQNYIHHWGETEFQNLADVLVKNGSISTRAQYMSSMPKDGIHLNFLPFLQGMLYVGNIAPLSTDDLLLVQSLAGAFSTAYARYEDFNKLESAKEKIEHTLTELKSTQSQLIQAEKMASLGELTAGIAHEIQNPLNFVNNFSEVSNELIIEIEEERAKNQEERDEKLVSEILSDIKQNLEKINHHGKRADAIVKGMLQHSRSSSGVKEPTDINALADEYLRLSYHGLRAKDKSFNADFKTEFDETLPKINIIPQDIGRVFLNLINNAFYAVSEARSLKHEAQSKDYKPTVTIRTKKADKQIILTVADNGNGIPDSIKEKIFQPFFTTKPTGSGTGLGLSLSYDIVKAHGGEIKVKSEESIGTEFIISIPIN